MANILSHSPESNRRGPVIRKYSYYSTDVMFECRSADRLAAVTLLSTVTSFRQVKSLNYSTDYITTQPTNIENEKRGISARDFSDTKACTQNSLDNLNTVPAI